MENQRIDKWMRSQVTVKKFTHALMFFHYDSDVLIVPLKYVEPEFRENIVDLDEVRVTAPGVGPAKTLVTILKQASEYFDQLN